MYKRGDRVLVEGYGGKTAVLRVWEVRTRRGMLKRSLMLAIIREARLTTEEFARYLS